MHPQWVCLTPEKKRLCSEYGVGKPCDPATGNEHYVVTDYVGTGPFPLAFKRTYNSAIAGSGRMGFNWVSSYGDLTATHTLFANTLTVPNTAQVPRPDGRTVFFKLLNGVWTPDADITDTLKRTADGWIYEQREGTVELYDNATISSAYGLLANNIGRLVSVTNGSGVGHTLTRDPVTGYVVSVTDTFGYALKFGYDDKGRLSTMTDPSNQVTAYAYDNLGNLVSVTYPDGTFKRYTYNEPGYVASSPTTYYPHALTGIYEGDDRYASLSYDSSGRVVLNHLADVGFGGAQRKFALRYDSAYKTTVTDAHGVQEVYSFGLRLGVKNLLSKNNLTDGKSLNQTFDANNNLTCKQNEEGQVATYAYNTHNQKIAETVGQSGTCAAPAPTPATRTTTYRYLSPNLDLPTAIETPSVYAGATKRKTIAYDSTRNPVAIADSGFTPAGAAVSRSVALSYNAYGQVISIDGPRTDVADITSLTYYECNTGDGCGQLRTVTNALGHTATYDSYDANGRLLQMTDPNGLVTSYTYDLRGRVASVTQTSPAGPERTSVYTYTAFGAIATATRPGGLALTYTYDAAQQLRTVIDNLGNKIDYTYDLKGNRQSETVTDASGTLVRSIQTEYDIRNRVASINNAGSITRQFHDALGTLLSETDPNQNPATVHTPDALGRVLQTIDRLSGTTAYAYDTQDRLTQVRAPNNATTQYTYDDLGNLLTEISPDRGTTQYAHDTAGNIKTQTDARGIASTYAYDALNRLIISDYPGSAEDVIYTYDTHPSTVAEPCTHGLGRLCQTNDASGITTYAYDAHGNLTAQDRRELGISYITRYTYNADHHIDTITYPNGRLIAYTRDALGRVTHIQTTVGTTTTTIASNIQYRADGLPTLINYNNGVTETRQYNARGQLLTQYIGAETRTYRYDANGNPIQQQNAVETHTYTPDALDRLHSDQGPSPFSYTYDANGNRLSQTAGSIQTPYQYAADSNRLSQVASTSYAYDAAGNLTQSGTRSYTYNDAGRLVSVQDGSTHKGSYTYNAQHQRTRKTAGHITVYHYDQAGHLIGETSDTGAFKVAYIYLPLNGHEALPIAQVTAATDPRPLPNANGQGAAAVNTHRPPMPSQARTPGDRSNRTSATGTDAANPLIYLHTDHLNTPRLATNATGAKVWLWAGEAFGNTPPNEDVDGDGKKTVINLRYAGQYYDGESGLHYNWNRYYDPRIGRYITSDSVSVAEHVQRWSATRGTVDRVPLEINSYLYGNANPLRFTDPLGLMGYGHGTGPFPTPTPHQGPFGPVCGSGAIQASWVPDGFLFRDWTDACQKHDDCYKKCGADRIECDRDLYSDTRSPLYYLAVRRLGQRAFDDAQKDCSCRR